MSAGDGSNLSAGDEAEKPPIYVRALRLKHIRPGAWWCFLFLEGSIGLAGVLVLADWVSPWGLLVLPLGVAIAVKLNDVITGALPPVGALPPPGAPSERSQEATDDIARLKRRSAEATEPGSAATGSAPAEGTPTRSDPGSGTDAVSATDEGSGTVAGAATEPGTDSGSETPPDRRRTTAPGGRAAVGTWSERSKARAERRSDNVN